MAMAECILKLLDMNPNAMGIIKIRLRSLHEKNTFNLFAIIKDTTSPIREPIEKLRAAPAPLYHGIKTKYRMARGMVIARPIHKT